MITKDFHIGQKITVEFVSQTTDSLMLRLPNNTLAWVNVEAIRRIGFREVSPS